MKIRFELSILCNLLMLPSWGWGQVGTIDYSFDPGAGFNRPDPYYIGIFPLLSPKGEVYVGGNFTTADSWSRNRLVRLDASGVVDTNWNSGPGLTGDHPIHLGVHALLRQPDGSISCGRQL